MSKADENVIRIVNASIVDFVNAMAGLQRRVEILGLELMYLNAALKESEESTGRGASEHGG